MKFILISTLYPNSRQPVRALYNQRHMEALRALGHEVEVIAPVPWFPSKRSLPPLEETIGGIRVLHPRFFYTPKLFIEWHWRGYQSAMRKLMPVMKSNHKAHFILGFVYPDAVAMASLCEEAGLEYSVLVLGSDFRVRVRQAKFKDRVMGCLQRAPRIFCPGTALKRDMAEAGIDEAKIHSFNNGVDGAVFHPPEKEKRERRILFVGNLVEVKAPERLLRAIAKAGIDCQVSIVGDGPLRDGQESLANDMSISNLVTFHGRQPPEVVAAMMRESACLCLCSKSEGMPNVVVEALACACPVVATPVGEVPFLVKDGVNGFVVSGASEAEVVDGLSAALKQTLETEWDAGNVAAAVNGFTWEAAAQVIIDSAGEK